MADWISFIHAPRDAFAATMTDEEEQVWGRISLLRGRDDEGPTDR